MSERKLSIVICATQRCGSTMVCEDMTELKVLGNPREYFAPWNPNAKKNWQQEAELMVKRGTTANGVFSVKIMANQMKKANYCLSRFIDQPNGAHYAPLLTFFGDAVWVWIKRRDTIAQAISQFRAKSSGVYHVFNGARGFVPGRSVAKKAYKAESDIKYDFPEILHDWSFVRRCNLFWEQFFKTARIEPILLHYEDICDSESYLMPIIAAAKENVEVGARKRNLVKLADAASAEIYERFVSDLLTRGC